MKRNFYTVFFILVALVFGTRISFATSLTLEHTFEGYYTPNNFPIYGSSDDDRYFYSPIIEANDGKISLKTYNENYTLRDNYEVTFEIPNGYTVQSVCFSSSLQLTDGTPFFMVTFVSESISMGDPLHCICKIYDARSGKVIGDLGSSTFSIMVLNTVFEINGKPSMVIIYTEYEKDTRRQYHVTRIYSLGSPISEVENVSEGDKRPSEPIYIYDMNGRLLNQTIPGQPIISIFSDGSSKVRMSR